MKIDNPTIKSINSGQLAGMRNRIINGDMRIDQRFAGNASTTGGYVVDRFGSDNATGTGTMTFQQSTLGNAKSFKITATVAVTDLSIERHAGLVLQLIEAQNVFDLNGKTVIISFKVNTNWTGNLPVMLAKSDFSRTYMVDVAVTANVTKDVSITLTLEAASILTNDNGIGLSLFIGINNEGNWKTATPGSWLAGFFVCSTVSTQWTKTTSNFINITEVQLEEGSVATPFEHRPIGVELALCQRYYHKVSSNAVALYAAFGDGVIESTTNAFVVQKLPVTMRAVPSVASEGSFIIDAMTFTSLNANTGGMSVNESSLRVVGTSGTVGAACALYANNNSTTFIAYTAEL